MLKDSTTQEILMTNSSSCAAGPSAGLMVGKEDAGSASTTHQNHTQVLAANSNNPPPPSKTDKPRPHACGTCQRCFARLEHLKRHERSHTKEKPFECPECSRCFARRDLLLRHQQKLHMTTTSSARTRNRRESTATTATPAGAGPGRVRKNSLVSGHGAVSGRPRANTISHMEGANMQLMTAANAAATTRPGTTHTHNRHASLAGLSIQQEYHQLRKMTSDFGQDVGSNGLPKLETHDFTGLDFGNGLRTAPLMGGFNYNFDNDGFLVGPNATINPSALHYSEAPSPVLFDTTSYQQQVIPSDNPSSQQLDESLDWMNGFDHQLSFQDLNECGIDGSSPSAISSASQSGISEIMLDGSNNPGSSSVAMWSQSSMPNPQMMMSNQFSLDINNIGFHDIINHGPLSPQNPVRKNGSESFFSTPPQLPSPMSPSIISGITTCHGWNALQGTRHRRSAD